MVFCSQMDDYLGSPDTRGQNIHGSVVFDLLNTASNFGVLDDVVSMVRQGHYWPKDVWKIWKRAWEMNECFWRVRIRCHHSLDLLAGVCGGSRYMSWWLVSDSDQSVMRDCETIVSLVMHSSVLRNDDVRLKGAPLGARLCDKCDLAALDDARHLVMQCPDLQRQRGDMMGEIAGLEGGFWPCNTQFW